MNQLKLLQDAYMAMIISGISLEQKMEWYDEEGNTISIEFIDGPRNCIVRHYWPSGELYLTKPYLNGVPSGICRSYYRNGNVWYEIDVKNGSSRSVSRWKENGTKDFTGLPVRPHWDFVNNL